HGAGERDADRRVQLADVDAQLQRVGRDDRQQLSGRELSLDVAPLLGRVAGAVGSDPLRQLPLALGGEAVAGQALDQLDPGAAARRRRRSTLATWEPNTPR